MSVQMPRGSARDARIKFGGYEARKIGNCAGSFFNSPRASSASSQSKSLRSLQHTRVATQLGECVHIFGVKAFEPQPAQQQAKLIQDLQPQAAAAAEGAGDGDGALFVAPPALDRGEGVFHAATAQERDAGGKACAYGWMFRSAAEMSLDRDFQIIDNGCLIEGRFNGGERCRKRWTRGFAAWCVAHR
jgi:hypothetical protein